MRSPLFASMTAIALGLFVPASYAVDPVTTQIGSTHPSTPAQTTPVDAGRQEAARQLAELTAEGRMWGLNADEMVRAKSLAGFRSSFTNVNLTPVEVLGIHARSDAERKRYAELFARLLHDDTVRVLAFQQAHAAAMARLYGKEPVLDLPKNALPRNFFGGGSGQ